MPDGHSGRGDDSALTLVAEETFRRLLSLERKRSERSRQRFVLMLVHLGNLLQTEGGEAILGAITKTLTSPPGKRIWGVGIEEDEVIGLICTEIDAREREINT